MSSKTKPGEKGFSLILLCIGIAALIESVRMYIKEPTSSSYGALPLFLSIVIVVFMIKIILFENKKTGSESDGLTSKEKLNFAIKFIFTKDILIIFTLLISYCVSLVLGIGFEISTSLFLVIAMSYLMRGQYIKNIIYTSVCMAFILIVFKTIFQVILP